MTKITKLYNGRYGKKGIGTVPLPSYNFYPQSRMKTDKYLRNNVLAELRKNAALRTCQSEIQVLVRDGIVALSGWVDSYDSKREAHFAASRTPGVVAVLERLDVRSPERSRVHTNIDWTSGSISVLA